MRRLFPVLAFLTMVIFACGPSSALAPTPAPTPDVPKFADGEAVAVVKTWLSGITFETPQYEHECATPTPSPRLTRLGSDSSCRHISRTFAGIIAHNCLSIHHGFQWNSKYLGNGVWTVTAQRGEHRSEWRVFEGTLAVDSVEVAAPGCG
jgi:hypothetical protein